MRKSCSWLVFVLVLSCGSFAQADCTLTPNLSLCTRTDTSIFTRANQNALVNAVDLLATNLTSAGLPKASTITNAMLAGSIDLPTKVTGILPAANFPALTGDVTTVAGALTTTIGAAKVSNAMLAGSIDLPTKVTGILPAANFPALTGDVTTVAGSLVTSFATTMPIILGQTGNGRFYIEQCCAPIFGFEGKISTTQSIGIQPAWTFGDLSTNIGHGGFSMNIGFPTRIPAGAKGNYYGYGGNLNSDQLAVNTGGNIGYAYNVTTSGGAAADGVGIAMYFDTVAPSTSNGVQNIFQGSMAKSIDGDYRTDGLVVNCGVNAPATVNCNGAGLRAWGAWKYGLDLETLTQAVGQTSWTAYINLVNNTVDNVATGILFADSKVDVGIDLNKNDISFLERTAPAAPAINRALLYSKDNGAGKTRLCALFNTGAEQCFATEP